MIQNPNIVNIRMFVSSLWQMNFRSFVQPFGLLLRDALQALFASGRQAGRNAPRWFAIKAKRSAQRRCLVRGVRCVPPAEAGFVCFVWHLVRLSPQAVIHLAGKLLVSALAKQGVHGLVNFHAAFDQHRHRHIDAQLFVGGVQLGGDFVQEGCCVGHVALSVGVNE
jgi:hypothetical protein